MKVDTPTPKRLLFVAHTSTVRLTEHWHIIKDGDVVAKELHLRHYSCRGYADGMVPKLFVGPGEKLVLLTSEGDAVFAWRRFIDDSIKELAVWCSLFRNESPILSSALILEAERVAACRWPGEHLYTHVGRGLSGCCFKKAGWRKLRKTTNTTIWIKRHSNR